MKRWLLKREKYQMRIKEREANTKPKVILTEGISNKKQVRKEREQREI